MNSKRIFTVAMAALVASGCATMNEDQCVASDWSAIGYEDGSNGYTSDRFGSYRKACAKHGITPDFRAYQEGRDEGLVEFCRPSRGYNLGLSGRSYNGVCDAALEEEFLDAYRVGHELYKLRAAVNSANSRIASREQELESVRESMRAKEAELIAPETTVQDRVLVLADLKEMSERTGELEAEIEDLVAERAQHEYALSEYEQSVAAYGF
jgi:hypothetical protein